MDFQKIENITSSVLEECWSSLFQGEIKIPVPIDLIATKLFELEIHQTNLPKGNSGELLIEENVILVNSKDTPERQRFTIAHELGHFCFHKKESIGSVRRTKSTKKETEANVFAAELLMPKRIFYEYLIKELMKVTQKNLNWLIRLLKRLPASDISLLNPSIGNYVVNDSTNVSQKEDIIICVIPNLSNKFGVSKDAITWRLKNLKLFDRFLSKEVVDTLSQL